MNRQAERFNAVKAKRRERRDFQSFASSPVLLHYPWIVYSDSAMWNVNERFGKKAIDSLAARGFGVGSTRGVVRGEMRGLQKLFLTDEGLKVPALGTHLENLRKFNEELRTALGVPTFHESGQSFVGAQVLTARKAAR